MRTIQCIGCETFPCADFRYEGYTIEKSKRKMIAEDIAAALGVAHEL